MFASLLLLTASHVIVDCRFVYIYLGDTMSRVLVYQYALLALWRWAGGFIIL